MTAREAPLTGEPQPVDNPTTGRRTRPAPLTCPSCGADVVTTADAHLHAPRLNGPRGCEVRKADPVVPMADDDLPDLTYEPPPGTELVGFYCFRAGGHLCEYSCKPDSVPLFAQTGWAAHVRESINEVD